MLPPAVNTAPPIPDTSPLLAAARRCSPAVSVVEGHLTSVTQGRNRRNTVPAPVCCARGWRRRAWSQAHAKSTILSRSPWSLWSKRTVQTSAPVSLHPCPNLYPPRLASDPARRLPNQSHRLFAESNVRPRPWRPTHWLSGWITCRISPPWATTIICVPNWRTTSICPFSRRNSSNVITVSISSCTSVGLRPVEPR